MKTETKYYIEQTHTPFGIMDEKGRECGVAAWATLVDHKFVWDGHTSQRVEVEPYVMVVHHALRGSSFYGPSPDSARIGLVSDPDTRAKAEAEIDRRVRETRKRYERKYRKT